VVLAYNHNTNKFLGQDVTQDQVEAMIKQKYPNMNIVVVNESATIEAVHEVDTKSI
jgi:predicted subunit of tRNA(5-methylaminomethyl-2-thiouridylate) methyltransferase